MTSQTFWMGRQQLKYQPGYIVELWLKLLNVENYFEMLHFQTFILKTLKFSLGRHTQKSNTFEDIIYCAL